MKKSARLRIPPTSKAGGEGGIRTLGRAFDPPHDFQSCTFNHSVTSPVIPDYDKRVARATKSIYTKNYLKSNPIGSVLGVLLTRAKTRVGEKF